MTTKIIAMTLLLMSPVTHAAVVEINWSDQGAFAHESSVEAGGFAEVCGPMSVNEEIAWDYAASAGLDFNIHYHQGEEVVYPVKITDAATGSDVLAIPVDQTYCWMWSNRQQGPVSIKFELHRSK